MPVYTVYARYTYGLGGEQVEAVAAVYVCQFVGCHGVAGGFIVVFAHNHILAPAERSDGAFGQQHERVALALDRFARAHNLYEPESGYGGEYSRRDKPCHVDRRKHKRPEWLPGVVIGYSARQQEEIEVGSDALRCGVPLDTAQRPRRESQRVDTQQYCAVERHLLLAGHYELVEQIAGYQKDACIYSICKESSHRRLFFAVALYHVDDFAQFVD